MKIQLRENNIQKTVSSILSSCNLPTTYVDNLTKNEEKSNTKRFFSENYAFDDESTEHFRNMEYATKKTVEINFL